MKGKTLFSLLLILSCIGCGPGSVLTNFRGAEANKDKWAVYYDYHINAALFASYDVVVLDRVYYPNFGKVHRRTSFLAYINAGEINVNAPDKILLENENALFGAPSRAGMQAVDLSSRRWHDHVMQQVEDAVQKGFDGVMLDMIDSPLQASAKISSDANERTRRASVTLIEEIRHKHPRIKIMLNRAFDILPQAAADIDYVLAESILTEKDDSTGQMRFVSANTFQQTAASLRLAQGLSPDIKIYTLDYWNTHDIEGVRRIYRLQREQGFSPYVTSPDLRHFTPEPE